MIQSPSLRAVLVAILWSFGSLTAVALVVNDLIKADGLAIPKYGVVLGRDFVNLWMGGKMAWSGHLSLLYDLPGYIRFMHGYFPHQIQHNYSYPPHTLFLGLVLSPLPYPAAIALWLIGTGGMFYYAARRYVEGFPPILAVLTPGAIVNVWDGQYGFLIGALWLMTFHALAQERHRAGAWAGLLTIKPHLGLLLPIVMAGKRRFPAIGIAIAVVVALVAASGVVFGFGLWRDYLTKVPAAQAAILDSPKREFYFLMMPSTMVALRPFPPMLALAGQIATAIVALLLLWRARAASLMDLAFIASTATFLILPYAFDYDMTVVVLGFAVLLFSRWDVLALWEKGVLSFGFLLPQIVLALGHLKLPFAPPILIAALLVQVRHRRDAVADQAGWAGSSPPPPAPRPVPRHTRKTKPLP